MIDLERSGRCRRHGCGRRTIRAGLCLDHLPELAPMDGHGSLPWPADLEPVTWRERYLARHGVEYRDAYNAQRRAEYSAGRQTAPA